MVNVEPAALLRPDPHVAAVVLHDVLDDREAEAAASGVAAARGVDPEEALEHPVALVLGDADALIRHRDLDDAVVGTDPDADARSVGRVLDGVGDQVVHGGHQKLLIPEHLGPDLAGGDERDAMRLRRDPVAVDGLRDDGVDARPARPR